MIVIYALFHVKLNNPQMGTEKILKFFIFISPFNYHVKLNNPQMRTENPLRLLQSNAPQILGS
mgnify:CR=1 FL=1